MSHLYTSLAFSLKNNAELLKKSSSGFKSLVKQIKTKNFTGKQSDHQRHLKYAMKMAAKVINKHGNLYLVNQTMRSELIFLSDALTPNLGIKFKTPIAHLIPRVPTASIIGNSFLFFSVEVIQSPLNSGGIFHSLRILSSERSCT